jgi:hypothetical protein
MRWRRINDFTAESECGKYRVTDSKSLLTGEKVYLIWRRTGTENPTWKRLLTNRKLTTGQAAQEACQEDSLLPEDAYRALR